MRTPTTVSKPSRSYVVSLDNRKARGMGHERAAEILTAARELFLLHGVENVSTRQIAGRVGISQTALYVYYKTKDEMLDALVEQAFAKLGSAFRSIREDDPVELLHRAIEGYIRFGLRNPDEYRIAFLLRDGRRDETRVTERPRSVGLRVFSMLEELVAACIAAGRIRRVDGHERATAQTVWAAVHGLVALMLAYPDFGWEATETLITTHAGMLLEGLIVRKRSPVTRRLSKASG